MNILDLLSADSITPRMASVGKNECHSGCPGCGDGGNAKTSDRFHSWPDQNDGEGSYWCRQCGKAGDIVQYLIDFRGMAYPAACEYLKKDPKKREEAVTPALPVRKKTDWQPKTTGDPADLWREKAEKFVSFCHAALLENKEQMDYLSGRGLNYSTIAAYRLGWNAEDRYRPREAWGVEIVIKADGKPKKLWLPKGLVIPDFDPECRVIRIRIRRPEPRMPEKPKYYIIPGSSSAPMLLGRNKEAFALIEAELDGLLVFQEAGNMIGVCALGSSSNRPDEATAQVLKNSLCLLDCLDYDAAGGKEKKFWGENFPQITRWPVPAGKDPGDAFAKGVNIRAWIMAGLPARWQVGNGKGKAEGCRLKAEDAAVIPVNVPEMGTNTDSPIARLAEMMRATPLFIIHQPIRLALATNNEAWKTHHWDVFGQISDLLFGDTETRNAVRDLPYGEYGAERLGKMMNAE